MRRINSSGQQQQNGHADNFTKVQGSMSEDEALAKAIYESMVQQQQNGITAGNGSTSSSTNDRNKNCAIS